jgi:HK97 family phage prohead protease
MIYKQTSIGIDDIDETNGIVSGYGSIFGNIDSDNDIILAGAYTKTLQENGSRVRYCNQHRIDQPLGKFTELREDGTGLYFVAQVPKTRMGEDILLLMKNGVITENSVGIMPIIKENRADGVRLLKECKLYEISCVTLAANPMALITDAKGEINQDLLAKRFDILAKMIKKENVSDELGYAIEGELMKLKSLFVDITTRPAEIVTVPEIKQVEISEIFLYLNKKIKSK